MELTQEMAEWLEEQTLDDWLDMHDADRDDEMAQAAAARDYRDMHLGVQAHWRASDEGERQRLAQYHAMGMAHKMGRVDELTQEMAEWLEEQTLDDWLNMNDAGRSMWPVAPGVREAVARDYHKLEGVGAVVYWEMCDQRDRQRLTRRHALEMAYK